MRNLGYRYANLSECEKLNLGVSHSLRVDGYYVTTSKAYCLALAQPFFRAEWSLGLRGTSWNLSRDSRPTMGERDSLAAPGFMLPNSLTLGTRLAGPEAAALESLIGSYWM